MVELDPHRAVLRIVDKPAESKLEYMWGIGCWSKVFMEFLASWVGKHRHDGREMLLSDAFQEAVDVGLRVKATVFDDGDYIDIGTPDDLYVAVRRWSEFEA
jgi:glucose-1-phosphate thymidylyltransferase